MTRSWVEGADSSDYSSAVLPLGVAVLGDSPPHVVTRIGDHVLDLHTLTESGIVPDELGDLLIAGTLNRLLGAGRTSWTQLRRMLTDWLCDSKHAEVVAPHLNAVSSASMVLPFDVADYVDFYSSEQHARNVGAIFRPDSPGLPDNWKHLPIAYHGRAGTVVVSGTDIVRPLGQRKPRDAAAPSFGPSTRLDIEAEVGFVVGKSSALGSPVPTSALADHVFGVVLVNDWSARDIQAWEYVPLGPFLGKSFATSISPWVVPLDALAVARCPAVPQHPPDFDYLLDDDPWCLDLRLSVTLNDSTVSEPPFATQYWSPGQQLAHLTINGASVRTGDLFASGTVTGPERRQRGSLLELSWGGREPFTLDDGT
ncbi:MAG: fumarylacetoacetate hydrolase family protein, partial [Actinomycetia bacterium]|nr:fumarylacetoacetate hydrolase family protein [Actinomycetes bacterium]